MQSIFADRNNSFRKFFHPIEDIDFLSPNIKKSANYIYILESSGGLKMANYIYILESSGGLKMAPKLAIFWTKLCAFEEFIHIAKSVM